MSKYYKKIKRKNKYREFIKVINGILQLTQRETDVLATLLTLASEQEPGVVEKEGILNMRMRRIVKQRERMDKTNLSKYEAKFKEKQILLVEDGLIKLNPLFKLSEIDNKINVEFILEFDKE